jgi:hypothetical protein
MDLKTRKASKAGTLNSAPETELRKTQNSIILPRAIAKRRWHDLLVHVRGTEISIGLSDKPVAGWEHDVTVWRWR